MADLRSGIVRYAGIVLIIIVLIIAIWILRRSANPREITVLNRFLKKLTVLGYPKGGSEGLEEFAARIPDEHVQGLALEFIRIFQNIYYTDRPFMTEDLRQLENIMEKVDNAR